MPSLDLILSTQKKNKREKRTPSRVVLEPNSRMKSELGTEGFLESSGATPGKFLPFPEFLRMELLHLPIR